MNGEYFCGQLGFAEAQQANFDQDGLAKQETLELVRAYFKNTAAGVRKRLFNLVVAVGV